MKDDIKDFLIDILNNLFHFAINKINELLPNYSWIIIIAVIILYLYFIKIRPYVPILKSKKVWKIPNKYKFYIIETNFPQGANRWTKRGVFERNLSEEANYFVYLKYDIEGLPLVVGKSGSRNVNSSGSDVSFDLNPNNGPARRYLISQDLDWDYTFIAIKPCRSQKAAYKLERKILRKYKIYGS